MHTRYNYWSSKEKQKHSTTTSSRCAPGAGAPWSHARPPVGVWSRSRRRAERVAGSEQPRGGGEQAIEDGAVDPVLEQPPLAPRHHIFGIRNHPAISVRCSFRRSRALSSAAPPAPHRRFPLPLPPPRGFSSSCLLIGNHC
jgi:hypothetical protein